MFGFFSSVLYANFLAVVRQIIDFTTYPSVFICVSNLDDFEGPYVGVGQVHVDPFASDVSLFDCMLEMFFFIIILLHSFLWILNFYCRSVVCM